MMNLKVSVLRFSSYRKPKLCKHVVFSPELSPYIGLEFTNTWQQLCCFYRLDAIENQRLSANEKPIAEEGHRGSLQPETLEGALHAPQGDEYSSAGSSQYTSGSGIPSNRSMPDSGVTSQSEPSITNQSAQSQLHEGQQELSHTGDDYSMSLHLSAVPDLASHHSNNNTTGHGSDPTAEGSPHPGFTDQTQSTHMESMLSGDHQSIGG